MRTATLKIYTVIIFCVVLCSGTGNHSLAQDSAAVGTNENSSHPYIEWKSQYPDHPIGLVKVNTVKKIYNFLVQKDKETGISRPVAIVGKTPASFWVLDQGAQTMYQVGHKKAERPKAFRKKENYFTSLVGVCELPDGQLLFTDSRLNKVYRFSMDEKKLIEFNDTNQLTQPTGIAYSAVNDEIWVVETGAHRISVFNRKGAFVRRIGARGEDTGKFNFPTSICIDKAGDVYIVDAMNFRVQILNKNGAYITAFGEAGDFSGSFARPKGIATDTYGNIYVSDALFHVVQIFDRAGNFLYSFGKQGREKEEFWMPAGIYIDSKNYIYVADSYNSRVQVFQLINGS